MLKAQDIRDQTVEELKALVNDKRKELFNMINSLKIAHKLDKPHLVRETKKDIARLLTIINEKQQATQTSGVLV
jgi:large subunit ribosomal protein L29